MSTCFVIQPFDGGIFDKRYHDVFEHAIRAAGLEPYRVDQDPSVNIPITDIEAGIKRSAVCFAEITTNNPNVWYELGYSIAIGKEVVLVCADDRETKFPFDIQHRRVIIYKTESSSDFNHLKGEITQRLKAIISKQEEIGSLIEPASVADTEGLSPYELVTLITAAQSMNSLDDSVPAVNLRANVGNAGFSDIAITLAFRKLLKKNLFETIRETGWNGEDFISYRVTEEGLNWLEENKDKLILKKTKTENDLANINLDDLPF